MSGFALSEAMAARRAGEAADPPFGRRPLLAVVLFHVATRIVTLAAVGWASWGREGSFPAAVMAWDGRWYAIIAQSGYPDALPVNEAGRVVTNPTGFFPLFPLLLRPLLVLGLPIWLAVLIETLVFSTGAAVVIALLVRRYTSDRTAVLTSWCWSVLPTASVLSFAYSEGLFTLLAAACLYFLVRERWVLAGLMAALAGLSRPTGVVVVAAVFVAAAVAVVRRRQWRSLWAVGIAPWGTVAALGYIGWSVGRWDAWFITEREGWGVRFDGGISTARWARDAIVGSPEPVRIMFALTVIAMIGLAVVAVVRRPPLPVLAYLVLGTILAVGQGGRFFLSPLRFLLPIFPLLVPAAEWLARRDRRLVAVIMCVLCAVSAGIGVYYFTSQGASP